MSWGRALFLVLRPALWIGPVLGLIGGALAFLVAVIAGGGPDIGLIVLTMVVGAILGLVVASPICLLLGTIMLKLSIADEQLLSPTVWASIGAFVGLVVGTILGLLATLGLGGTVLVAGTAASLGALGGYLCRRSLAEGINALFEVDTEVFD
jgi:hypothetical protein